MRILNRARRIWTAVTEVILGPASLSFMLDSWFDQVSHCDGCSETDV